MEGLNALHTLAVWAAAQEGPDPRGLAALQCIVGVPAALTHHGADPGVAVAALRLLTAVVAPPVRAGQRAKSAPPPVPTALAGRLLAGVLGAMAGHVGNAAVQAPGLCLLSRLAPLCNPDTSGRTDCLAAATAALGAGGGGGVCGADGDLAEAALQLLGTQGAGTKMWRRGGRLADHVPDVLAAMCVS